MLVHVVRASVKPDQRDRWFEVMRGNAAATRSEEGCEGYQAAEDFEVPNAFVIIEHWANLESIHRHFRNQFRDLMAALGDAFAAPPEAFVYEVASTLTLEQVLEGAGIAR